MADSADARRRSLFARDHAPTPRCGPTCRCQAGPAESPAGATPTQGHGPGPAVPPSVPSAGGPRRYAVVHTDHKGDVAFLGNVIYSDRTAAVHRVEERREAAEEFGWPDRYDLVELVNPGVDEEAERG